MKKHIVICITLFFHFVYALVLAKLGLPPLEIAAHISSAFFLFTVGFMFGYWW